jgi:hypothetical protein
MPDCYAPPILGGSSAIGASAVYFASYIANGTLITNSTITIPESALPTSGHFSVGCIVLPSNVYVSTGSMGAVFTIAEDASHFGMFANDATSANAYAWLTSGASFRAAVDFSNGLPVFELYTYNGTDGSLYINGILGEQTTDTPGYADAAGGIFGANYSGGTASQFYGELQDCFVANTALTSAQIWTLASAAGFQ